MGLSSEELDRISNDLDSWWQQYSRRKDPMYQPQVQQQSYRLGDRANSSLPDGDFYMRGTSIEATTTKDGNPQLKASAIVLGGPQHGRTHTWWWSLSESALWRLFNDLIALGFNPDYDLGPPEAQRYAMTVSQGFVNHGFQANVKMNGDFSNTKIRGPIQLGPDGMPIGLGAGAQSAPGVTAPNAPTTVHPAAAMPPPMSFGNNMPVPSAVAPQPPNAQPAIQPANAWPNQQVTAAGAPTVVEQRTIDGVLWEKLSTGEVRQAQQAVATPSPWPAATTGGPAPVNGAPQGFSDVTALFRQG